MNSDILERENLEVETGVVVEKVIIEGGDGAEHADKVCLCACVRACSRICICIRLVAEFF